MQLDELRTIPFFSFFDENKLVELQKISSIVYFFKDDILFYEDDKPTNLFYLQDGLVRLLKNKGELKQFLLHEIKSQTFIAELTMFEDILYPATCEAITDIKVVKIDLQKFRENFLSNNSILSLMVKSLSAKLKFLMNTIELETAVSAEAKVLRFLERNNNQIKNLTHRQIASNLNIAPETLSRVLKKLKNKNVLKSTNPIVLGE